MKITWTVTKGLEPLGQISFGQDYSVTVRDALKSENFSFSWDYKKLVPKYRHASAVVVS